jgi:3-oxoacyl-[acyl-carrier protein] reductase
VTNPRCILVTGASRGIGRACVLKLAADGFDVAVHCRAQREAADAVAAEIIQLGRGARVLQFDLADRAACAESLNADIKAHGAYYGVVANAGLTRDNIFPAMSGEEWDSVLRTNLDGFYNVLQPAVMPMIRARRGGRIVTLSSVSGMLGNKGQVNYSAAKAGLIGASKALALELASRNITVNVVAPGLIDTDMTAALPKDEMVKVIPAGRTGSAGDVAAVVAFLCSDAAAYVTRQVIGVNGGLA